MPIILKFRATGGSAGAPSALKTGEHAYNMADGKMYVGYGDDGSGNATSIRVYAKDDFVANVPAGGTTGQVLAKNSATDGDLEWIDGGTLYTASGDGIELSGTEFSLNYTEIATGLSLSTYATDAELSSGLAGKADVGHVHAGEDITSGTIDPARLPAAVFQAPIVASSNIASLSAPQQAEIVEGSTVVTTDGRFWTYTGSGSKTSEASYVEMADKTPAWSVIADKPANVTSLAGVAGTSGSALYFSGANSLAEYATTSFGRGLANLADAAAGRTAFGLGTIATQNANNVTVTGGSISGTTVDGGTF